MTWESFFTGALAVLIFLLSSAVAGVLLSLLFGGAIAFIMRLRERITGKRKQRKNPQTNSQQPEVQPELPKDIPQPASDQQRLYEIEESIFWSTGAIQANPMSPGATALSKDIQRLECEKMEVLKKIADDTGRITVQKVWNTFLPEQQEKFQERIYQYEQDVNRGGTEPEIAAANRGLMIVNGSPVPKEVAQRMDEMRNAVFSDDTVDTGQTGQSQKKVRSGRPEKPISVICQLSDECNKDGAFYSFEQHTREVTLVKNQTHCLN